MAYGKIKADAIIYDDSGSDVEKTIAVLASAAPTASPTFTGDVTLTGAANNVVFDASDNALEFADNAKARFGGSNDLEIYHSTSGNDSYIDNNTNKLYIRNNVDGDDGGDIIIQAKSTESSAKFIHDGAVELYHDGTKKIETTAAGVTVAGSVTDDKGDVRKIIQNTQGSSYTLVAADAGKHILASGTVTIPNSVFAAGDAVSIVNNTGSDLTITKTITTMYNTADGTSDNRTLATRGMATILFASGTVAYISGSGLS